MYDTLRTFAQKNRKEQIQQLKSETLDLLVIGGGITGSGIALDAQSRGLQVGLLEMQDFSAGTSSRSTKLIHGGLRYLKQLEVKIVSEVGKERAIVYENGPHVTTPEWMMLPFYKKGTFGPFSTNVGLYVYDRLAGVEKDERRKMLSAQAALEKEPLLKEEDLKGAGYYVEYKTDDARLTIEVLKKAVEYGALAFNYLKVIDLIYDESNRVIGVVAEDQLDKETVEVFAKKIINATGPWVDTIRDIDDSRDEKSLYITKGVHIVFPKEVFPLQQAIYFDAPDGRMIFAIPRDDKTYVGTTDTVYDEEYENPTVTEEDKKYLLNAIEYMFPSLQLTMEDIHSYWAGLRPLIAQEGKDPGEISREDEIFISSSGLLSIAGGKLTGYRKMAERIVDIVVDQLAKEEAILYSASETAHLPIAGGEVGGSKGFQLFKEEALEQSEQLGIDPEEALKLIHRYGKNVEIIFRYYQNRKNRSGNSDIDPLLRAELDYCLRYESIYKPSDFFVRRTGDLYFNVDRVQNHKEEVIQHMAKYFQWNQEEKKQYTEELERLIPNLKTVET